MSSSYCHECGSKLEGGAVFCANCGAKAKGQSKPVEQEDQIADQTSQSPQYTQPYQQQPQQHRYTTGAEYTQPREHMFPPNYQPTQTISERIMGTLKMDEHVIEEIEYRDELQDEAWKLLLVNFTVLSIIKIITVFTVSFRFEVYNSLGAAIEIILTEFLGGLVFIYALAYVGRNIGGMETQVDRDEMIRVLSYAYVARVIESIVGLVDDVAGNLLISLVWLVVLVWSLFVVLKAIKQALDKGYGTALISVVIAFIIEVIAATIILVIVESIFGGTTYQVL